ncbi:hypothetical protein BDZ89DRAFT_659603 [Hymenopellis radicata]|nr:hypothetical protein BDZ89DRAFT_659603 [Hymenopellis radicata]
MKRKGTPISAPSAKRAKKGDRASNNSEQSSLESEPGSISTAGLSKLTNKEKKALRAQNHKSEKKAAQARALARSSPVKSRLNTVTASFPTPQSIVKPLTASLKQNTAIEHPKLSLSTSPIAPNPHPVSDPLCPPGYTLLNDVSTKTPYAFFNVVGVVVSCALKSTIKDHCAVVSIRDPSTLSGLSINCFNPIAARLPNPAPGDVVILRNLKTANGPGAAVGYDNRLTWSIFKSGSGLFYPQGADGSDERRSFSFHTPNAQEIEYCKQLLQWKQSTEAEKEKNLGVVCDLNESVGRPFLRKAARKHQLICDAHADTYYDVTVELVDIYAGDRTTTIFVTDYTKNDRVRPVTGRNFSTALAPYILSIECWDDAQQPASEMEVGGIYSLGNLRIRVCGDYEEGKLNERKISKLNPEYKDSNLRLKEFFIRRDVWRDDEDARGKVAYGTTKRAATIPVKRADTTVIKHAGTGAGKRTYSAIGDAQEGRMFNCVAEILGVHDEDQTLFVSDYTKSDLLLRAEGDFLVHSEITYNKDHLLGRVLPIRLQNSAHFADAKALAVGEFCVIDCVRIRINKQDKMRGYLNDRSDNCLITKVLPDSPTHSPSISQLLERKETLLGKPKKKPQEKPKQKPQEKQEPQEKPKQKPKEPVKAKTEKAAPTASIPLYEFDLRRCRDYKMTTVEDLRDDPSPGNFKVIAHVLNFRPVSLKDCVVAWCAKCKKDLPKTHKACFACNDIDHEFIRLSYRWMLQLGHKEEGGLRIYADNESPLFEGLKRVDLHTDDETYDSFYKRVKPILGPSEETFEPGPTLTFFIKTRLNVDGELIPFLQGYRAVET